MGPRSDERGNTRCWVGLLSEPASLQWGRVRMNAEIGTETGLPLATWMLQWGRVRMNAEMAWSRGGPDPRRSFNGAAFG